MKVIRQLIFLTTTLTLLGCPNIDNSINGHWHSTTPDIGTFNTLDINDSITVINKLEIDYTEFAPFPRKDSKTGKLFLPFQEYASVDTYNIDNDTLNITDSGYSYKYVKSDFKECELADRYRNSVINISLIDYFKAEDYDKLLYTANLFIGNSIKSEYERPKSTPDSIFIQADDVFIKLGEVSRYCNEKESAFLPDDQISLVLHADRQVNELFIQRLIKEVPVTILIYKAVNREGHLSVIKLSRD